MGNLAGWKMLHTASGGEVLPGTKQLNHRGEECTVLGATVAPEGNSTGRVAYTDSKGHTSECYPQVFGLRLVPEGESPAEVKFEMPDTVEELLESADAYTTYVHTALSGGPEGLAQILTEVGDARIMEMGEAVAMAVTKAYCFGYVEGKSGRRPAVQMMGHIIKGDDHTCGGEHCDVCGVD